MKCHKIVVPPPYKGTKSLLNKKINYNISTIHTKCQHLHHPGTYYKCIITTKSASSQVSWLLIMPYTTIQSPWIRNYVHILKIYLSLHIFNFICKLIFPSTNNITQAETNPSTHITYTYCMQFLRRNLINYFSFFPQVLLQFKNHHCSTTDSIFALLQLYTRHDIIQKFLLQFFSINNSLKLLCNLIQAQWD
jgi:hypothetical protein